MLLFAPAALADSVICESGSGAGQCTAPSGVAVDRQADILYVADNGNQEIDAYDANAGGFLDDFEVGASLSGIAVDNDPESTAQGDVYVFDTTNNRVLKLRPSGGGSLELVKAIGEGQFIHEPAEGQFSSQHKLDVGPEGVIYVADNIGGGDRRVQKFDHEGAPIESCAPLLPGEFGGNLQGFAVESSGGFYLASAGGRPIERYDSGCGWLEEPFHSSFNIQALATDGEDNLFVADVTGDVTGVGGETAIYAYDATRTLTKVLYGDGTVQRRPVSLAPHSSPEGDIFVSEGQAPRRVVHVAFPPPGPVVHPDAKLTRAEPIGNTWATLNTRINPEGKATDFHFQYVDEETYEAEGFANPTSTAEAEVQAKSEPPFVPPLFGLPQSSQEIGCPEPSEKLIEEGKCLKPSTVYHFRAVASNADGGPRIGPESQFETRPPFEILATWASEVGADAAKLSAEVNPLNIPTAGRFQYVDEAAYQQDLGEGGEGFGAAAETEEVDFGEGEAPTTRTAQLRSLTPGTAYRYRVVVENSFGNQEDGPTHAFETYPLPVSGADPCPNSALRYGPGAQLPDCRAYEMVSPVDKAGGEIVANSSLFLNLPAELNQSAIGVPAQGRGLTYSSNRAFGDAVSAPFTSQYMATRNPLGHAEEGWRSDAVSPPREGASFLSETALDTQYKAFSQDLRWGWLRSDSEPPLSEAAIAGFANLYRRDDASDAYEAICPVAPPNAKGSAYVPAPQGHSADGQTTVFRANDKLHPDASAKEGIFQLYACRSGALEVVSVLSGGAASEGNSSAGTGQAGAYRSGSIDNALSEDGNRVYWTDSGTANNGPGRIYLRERPFGEGGECTPGGPCTVAVSEAVIESGAEQAARFWGAAADGAAAIFSFTEGPLSGNLYRFEAEGATASEIAKGVSGVAGISEDAERVYFVSEADLDEEGPATAGIPNLYLHEAGAGGERLVASLPGGAGAHNLCLLDTPAPFRRCTRATPDGQRLAFVSQDSLTGYDNADAASGEADAEVYLYDSTAGGGAGQLLCVSCNPSGARPAGRAVPVIGTPDPAWVAAQIPAWQNALHAPRVLSGDGRRLFFESYDRLLPADTNGALDVYQWEEAGKGGCDAKDANHFPQNGGCIELISSGQSPRDSRFVDASADGRDVFFKTAESLYPADPGLIDIYDARLGGGFPAPEAPSPPCEGEACQSPPPPPQAPTPSSSSFAGPGNLPAPAPNCRRAARKAKAFSKRAKRLRRAAKRSSAPRRAKQLRRRKAKGLAKRAKRHSRAAKRCRARAERAAR